MEETFRDAYYQQRVKTLTQAELTSLAEEKEFLEEFRRYKDRSLEEAHRAVMSARVANGFNKRHRFFMGGPLGDLDDMMEELEEIEQDHRESMTSLNVEWSLDYARQAVENRDKAAVASKTAKHYARLKAKYQHAARYPWLSVEPDSPPLEPVSRVRSQVAPFFRRR